LCRVFSHTAAVSSSGNQDFVRKCLVHDPRDRPTAQQLLEHIWVRGMAEEDEST